MTTKPKICKNPDCGKEFVVRRFMQVYCSPSCQIAHTKETTKGWGKRPVINSKPVSAVREHPTFVKNRELLKQQIRSENDGLLGCEECRTIRPPFETHHLIFRSEKPNHPHLHDIKNLYHVCIPCHNLFHSKKGHRDEIVAERKLNLLFGEDVLNKSKL